jgi:glycosyltransferase involved in cell wall biosynthesis
MTDLFGASRDKTHVVPNGVDDVFLNSQPLPRGPWLVCTATITERKRVLELAAAAVRAQTPLWIIGKPYSETEAYAQRFLALARAHPQTLRYEGPIQDRATLARVYREARGFVLLSAMESLSLSALEAAACECPLLLSRLPWATTVFRQSACYCPLGLSADRTAGFLRQFYDAAPGLKPLLRPLTWLEVGRQLKRLYEGLLSRDNSAQPQMDTDRHRFCGPSSRLASLAPSDPPLYEFPPWKERAQNGSHLCLSVSICGWIEWLR